MSLKISSGGSSSAMGCDWIKSARISGCVATVYEASPTMITRCTSILAKNDFVSESNQLATVSSASSSESSSSESSSANDSPSSLAFLADDSSLDAFSSWLPNSAAEANVGSIALTVLGRFNIGQLEGNAMDENQLLRAGMNLRSTRSYCLVSKTGIQHPEQPNASTNTHFSVTFYQNDRSPDYSSAV